MGKTLGILQQDPDAYLKRGVGGGDATDAEIERLLAMRRAARVGSKISRNRIGFGTN